MIVLLALVVALVVTLIVFRIRARRRNADLAGRPLSGYDTGSRSPFRTPGSRFFGPRRGF